MNISLEHPFFTAKKELLKLCKPLFRHTPFMYFTYSRYYYDGYYILLSHIPELDHDILQHDYLPKLEELNRNTAHYVFLSTALAIPEAAIYPEPFIQNIHHTAEHGIHHRLFLTFNAHHYVETFEYGIKKYNKNVFELFMNHVNYLEKFSVYFRQSTAQLVESVEKYKVTFDSTLEPIPFRDLDLQKNLSYQKFLDEIKIKKFSIQCDLGKKTLSAREIECLIWIAKDKSAKQIAQILSLSPRTVESYIENMKIKLGCKTKQDLIRIALNESFLNDCW